MTIYLTASGINLTGAPYNSFANRYVFSDMSGSDTRPVWVRERLTGTITGYTQLYFNFGWEE